MKNFILGLGLLSCLASTAQQLPRNLVAANSVFIGFYEYKPTDYNLNPTTKYPLIIFLHGIGERGNGTTELSRVLSNAIPRYINGGHPMRFFWNGKWETFLVLSPQLASSYIDWQDFYVDEMIKYAKQNLQVDTNRIILTGLSLGGGGTWHYASSSLGNAQQLAAIAPVCGTCSMVAPCNLATANTPVWAFHALDDGVVGVGCATSSILGINNCNPAEKPLLTLYANGGHFIWDRAYDTTYNWQNPNIYEWFLGKNKSLPVNIRPTADAGQNITISTVTAQVTLSGALSLDPDGNIVRYMWREISGPAGVGFVNGATPIPTLTGLTVAGTYQIELTVVDNRTDLGKDTVTVFATNLVIPNIPPIAEAGLDLSTDSTTIHLNGTATYDPDGIVASYNWTKLSGPAQYNFSNTTVSTPTVSNLTAGTYEFVLTATDNQGAIDKDTVVIRETNAQIPVKLIYFRGKNRGNDVQLFWATASEHNNDHFEIERSKDGRNFETIGTIQRQSSSSGIKEYSFTDIQLQSGIIYYRLRQVDVDGHFEYSPVVTVNKNAERIKLEYFPNPVKNTLTIMLEDRSTGTVYLKIFSLDGKLQQQYQISKPQENISITTDLSHLRTGIYMLEINIGNEWREVRKIIKQ